MYIARNISIDHSNETLVLENGNRLGSYDYI